VVDSFFDVPWRKTLHVALVGATLVAAGCGGGGGGTEADDSTDSTGGTAGGTGGTGTGGTGTGGNTGGTQTGGTPAGFALLKDIHQTNSSEPGQFVVVGAKTYFIADDGVHGRELWVSDGTVAGTRMVKDIRPGVEDAFIARLTEFNGKVAFSASDGVAFEALWISDGTEAGTQMVKDISPTSENPIFIGVSGTKIYFTAQTSGFGRELWVSDGTSNGTYMVADTNPGTASSEIQKGLGWNGKFYFYGYDATTYSQLYVTDGTMGNIQRLTPGGNYPGSVLLDYDMIVYKSKLYFTWHTYASGVELWATDGTVGGTSLFADPYPKMSGGSATSSWPSHFDVLNDTLLFFAYGENTGFGGSGKALWKSTGSTPELVANVTYAANMDRMVLMNGRYYFPGRTPSSNFGLWSTDGTSAGTAVVSNAVSPDAWYYSNKVAVIGTKLVFQGQDAAAGMEPWVSDGTSAGTQRLSDIYPGTSSSYRQVVGAGWITARSNKAYFIARTSADDYHLYETDGTSAGTAKIALPNATVTVNPMGRSAGASGIISFEAPVLVGSTLVFACHYTSAGAELCKM
jgi:ELWxxDGT repeat protein